MDEQAGLTEKARQEFRENARVFDPFSVEDLKRCMKKLREFREMTLKVDCVAALPMYAVTPAIARPVRAESPIMLPSPRSGESARGAFLRKAVLSHPAHCKGPLQITPQRPFAMKD